MINEWKDFFDSIKDKPYFKRLEMFWKTEYSNETIFPPKELIFNAFNLTSPSRVKAVILGQDPYHEPGQAMGLSFSVPKGIALPPSLRNIYKEIESEFDVKMDFKNGDLTSWANQGVLLLNAYLTVKSGEALSHAIPEYKELTKDIMNYLDSLNRPIAFLLWGGFAKKYAVNIKNARHICLLANHPSPLSANRGGWFGSNCFAKCNEFLSANGIEPIDWKI